MPPFAVVQPVSKDSHLLKHDLCASAIARRGTVLNMGTMQTGHLNTEAQCL